MTISATIMALFIETHYATLTKSQVDPGQPFRSEQRGKEGREQARKKSDYYLNGPVVSKGQLRKWWFQMQKKKKKKLISRIFIIFSQRAKVAWKAASAGNTERIYWITTDQLITLFPRMFCLHFCVSLSLTHFYLFYKKFITIIA